MSARSVKSAARTAAANARAQVAAHGSHPAKGIVRVAKPLGVELIESGLMLDDDDITLGYSVQRYDNDHGIQEGDTLFLMPTRDAEWLALDVVTSREPAWQDNFVVDLDDGSISRRD